LKKLPLIILLFFLFCTSQPVAQPDNFLTQTNEHLQYGLPSLDGQLIIREGYAFLHDSSKKVPLWVSYLQTSREKNKRRQTGRIVLNKYGGTI